MNKQRKREIGELHLYLKLLNSQLKEWDKILKFLKQRRGINEGRDKLIKEAYFERNKIKDKMQNLISDFKTKSH